MSPKPSPDFTGSPTWNPAPKSAKRWRGASKLLADAGVKVQGVVAHTGPVTRAVAEIAREADADLIVIGSSRMGDIGSLFLGSVSFDLLQMTDRPALRRRKCAGMTTTLLGTGPFRMSWQLVVHVAGPLTPFKLLVRLIDENRVDAIPIVDQQGVPVKSFQSLICSSRNGAPSSTLRATCCMLTSAASERAEAAGTVASELMTSPAITIPSDTGLGEAARLMHEKNVRRLVVVDQRGRIAGIVSRSDLLQVFLCFRRRPA